MSFRRTSELLRPRWGLLLGAVFFAMFSAGTNAGFALIAGSLADFMFHGTAARAAGVSSWWFPGPMDSARIVMSLGFVTVVRVCGTLGSAWVTARLGTQIAHELRTMLYERVAANALPRNLAHHRGDLVSRLQDDVYVIQTTLTYSVSGLAHTVLSTVMVGGVILSIDPLVGLASLLGVPLAALIVREANRRYYGLYEVLRADHGLLDGRIEEIVDLGDVVRSLGAEQRMSTRFAALSDRVRATSLSLAWTSALTKPLISVAAALGIGALILYWQNFGSAPPPAEQAALLSAAAILIRPVHAVSDLLESFTSARRSMARVDEILDTPLLGALPLEGGRRPAELLRGEGLSFSFGERQVLSEISFSLRRGRSLALVGASGAGKTTLLRLIAGLLEPAQGTLDIDGTLATSMGMRAYRRHFGWVPQEARLLFDEVGENLRLGRPEASNGELAGALAAAGLSATMASFPAGLNTMIGDDGSPFSVGQRQRLCIARALVTAAPILVLDEPTAALDERQAEDFHGTLERLREQVAVLIASHRLSSVNKCDWVLVLEDGRIVEQGKPEVLLATGPRFRRLFAQDLVAQQNVLNTNVG